MLFSIIALTLIGDLWEKYKNILDTGIERNDHVRKLEGEIHAVQKEKGWALYDFDKRWIRKEQNAKASVTGPPPMDSPMPTDEKPVPTSHFTFDQAKDRIGDNNFDILEECAMMTEAEMICLEHIHDKLNPDNKNVARRGQAMNWTERKYAKRKEE